MAHHEWDWCSTCGAFSKVSGHRCLPVWKCWCEEYDETQEDGFTQVYAGSAEAAAGAWADETDEHNDYALLSGSSVQVTVMGKDGRKRVFSVSGESVPEYSAAEVKQEEGAKP